MLFKKKTQTCGFEVIKEGNRDVLYISCSGCGYSPSLEDSPICMARTVDKLMQVPSASAVIFSQSKNYVYDYEQVQMLMEIAFLYNHFIKQKRMLSLETIQGSSVDLPAKHAVLQNIVLNLLRSDPIGAYVELRRLIRDEKIKLEKVQGMFEIERQANYVELLTYIYNMLDKTKLISLAKPYLAGHIVGTRTVYKNLFRANITPNFILTKLMMQPPLDADELDVYSIGKDADVTIFSLPGSIKNMYYLNPPEFKLSEDKYELIELARNVMIEHKPGKEEFTDPEKMRQTFLNIGRDLLLELANSKGIEVNVDELEQLAEVLVRYTVGFGLVEVLLQDPKIQDISINGPIGETPIFVVHQDYDECTTNIIPSREDGESWASKLRILSGRPLDEANPILDTELIVPGARARVAAISRPLTPVGLAYAFRRHRDKPWTLPLFIHAGFMSPLSAGLISFLIDGARTVLVAGTRGSGKTSLLGACMVELMRNHRIITLEDTLELPVDALRNLGYNIQPLKVRSALTSGGGEVPADEGIRTSLRMGDSSLIVGEIRSSIRGSENVVIVENGETKRIPIQDLEGRDIEKIYVPTMGFDLKMKLSKLTGFVKHPKRNKLLKVRTRTGREITVTPDHSLFTSHNFKIFPIECKDIKIGSKIVLPSKIPCGYNDINYLNLLDIINDARVENFEEPVREIISKIGWKEATSLCDIKSGDIYNYYRRNQKTNIPINSFNKLMLVADKVPDLEQIYVKNGTSNTLSALLPVNEDFCRFLGYFISEGYFSQTSVLISNSNENIISDVVSLGRNLFNVEPYIRETKGLGISRQVCITNSPLIKLLKKLNCGRISKEKKIPSFIFGLSESKIYAFLSGLYAGDGNFASSKSSGNCIRYYTISKRLADDLMYLLLHIGIVSEIRKRKNSKLSDNPIYIIEFKDRSYVKKFLDNVNFVKYKPVIIENGVSHSSLNTIHYDIKELEEHLKLTRKYRHLRKYNSCGKNFLKKLVLDEETDADKLVKTFADGEFYLDEVKEIEELDLECGEYVYDLSVEPSQNFIGGLGGILLHNTEAKALYEAMRVGALANLVAGTIHGDSPYGVFDRVVNDLEVPRTSFKATDIILVANPVKSADGLHRWRRLVEITEVRKHWEQDPLAEKGFVDLMKYNTKYDALKPTDDLINGDSEILKNIAGSVKEWAGNWDAVWDNVMLRAKIKEALVSYAVKSGNLGLLEADFVISSNDAFHKISDSVKEEVGSLDSRQIYFQWSEWFKKALSRRRVVA